MKRTMKEAFALPGSMKEMLAGMGVMGAAVVWLAAMDSPVALVRGAATLAAAVALVWGLTAACAEGKEGEHNADI